MNDTPEDQDQELTVAVVWVPTAESCWTNHHRTISLLDGFVCEDCSTVAAAARERGASRRRPELELAAFRAGGERR